MSMPIVQSGRRTILIRVEGSLQQGENDRNCKVRDNESENKFELPS